MRDLVRCCAVAMLVSLPISLIVLLQPSETTTAQDSATPDAYTKQVKYLRADHSLFYGDEAKLRARPPFLPDATYRAFVAAMPIVCVDVLLTRSNGDALLVLRHAEPVRALYWYPGGRLLMGESFSDAALRKARKEIGLSASYCQTLGTWNTLFEKSAWGGPTQTVNILVHATTIEAWPEPRVCGDRKGTCADGRYGGFKWVAPGTSDGEDTYILEGLAALRDAGGGTACGGGAVLPGTAMQAKKKQRKAPKSN